jgi:chemotaxis protein MotB
MSTPSSPIIVVRKVVKGHGGHHGGAWKVAYADFVTAMMALFIVLWLMNADEQTRQAVAGYFKDPSGRATEIGSGAAGSGANLTVQQDDMSKLKEKIENVMRSLPELSGNVQKQVQMTVTGEGLRIEMLENETGVFFEKGNAQPTDGGHGLLSALALELHKIPNTVLVEGHTDARPFVDGNAYSNWELSRQRRTSRTRSRRAAVRSHQASTWVRRSATASADRTGECVEPPGVRRCRVRCWRYNGSKTSADWIAARRAWRLKNALSASRPRFRRCRQRAARYCGSHTRDR